MSKIKQIWYGAHEKEIVVLKILSDEGDELEWRVAVGYEVRPYLSKHDKLMAFIPPNKAVEKD